MLYIIATPIGNLEDITLRALRILEEEADIIVCEDTRVTKKLLNHYNIEKRLYSFRERSSEKDLDKIMKLFEGGKNIAYVSDAGTPGISDPGGKLVERAVQAGISVTPIPGVTAITTLASVSGRPMREFSFVGFPPHKKGRETFFRNLSEVKVPTYYYESPHRFLKNITLLETFAPQGKLVIGRELTKMHEEVIRGTVQEVRREYELENHIIKGEFVICFVPE